MKRTVAIVGGGLAGLAAGCALTDAGFRVTVFERKPYLGGRASSYEYPGTGEVVDNCQHVLLGCCTNLIDFYRRIGAEHLVRWYDRLTFIEPGGRRSTMATSALPPPLHTAPSFLRAAALSWRDKLAIARALMAMLHRTPTDDGRSFLEWLRAHGQTEGAIERFWKVVLVSALNEDLDRMSTPAAAMVFRESFLKSVQGGRMGVPRVPLTELYSKAGDYICAHGGSVELRTPVETVEPIGEASGAAEVWASRPGVRVCAAGKPRMLDYAVMAVPFDVLARLLPQAPEAGPLRAELARFETSPITGVHLWFDRQVTDLDHAVLLDRTIQWMFHKSQIQERSPFSVSRSPLAQSEGAYVQRTADSKERATGNGERGTENDYLEIVISASKALVNKSRAEVIELTLHELAEFFPAVREAKLVKATVVKEVRATYSPLPGSDVHRPAALTPWPQMFLAGDWTATGWPATMEGAVRSGYLAAEALCRSLSGPRQFLVPDLPPSGLMRLIS
ncbi:MAG: hydroxysqualene dehydroxylase HpnE [Terriglobales bacterium]